MRGHTYHDHILDPLSERDREVVTNLVSEVQIKYTRYLALMVQRNPITWHDALEWIHNDLLGFLRDDKQLQELKVRIRGEANAPLYGSTLETLQRYARDATKWCKEVQCGLQKAEEHLAPHFDQAWATKALLYLRDVFGEQVPQSRPNYNLQVEKTYKMMRKYSPHVVVATVKKLIDNHDSNRPLKQQASKQFRHKHFGEWRPSPPATTPLYAHPPNSTNCTVMQLGSGSGYALGQLGFRQRRIYGADGPYKV